MISSLLYYFYLPKNIEIFYSLGEDDSFIKQENPNDFYLILNTNENKKILDEFDKKYSVKKMDARFCTIKKMYILEKDIFD